MQHFLAAKVSLGLIKGSLRLRFNCTNVVVLYLGRPQVIQIKRGRKSKPPLNLTSPQVTQFCVQQITNLSQIPKIVRFSFFKRLRVQYVLYQIGEMESFVNLIARKIFYIQRWKYIIRLYVFGRSCDLDDSLKQHFVDLPLKFCLTCILRFLTGSLLQNSLNICFFLIGGKRRVFITKLFINLLSWQQLPSVLGPSSI